jgi:HAD superfamily hydrolase (TIGR01509 family)
MELTMPRPEPHIGAVLFDLDGTLLDSEPAYFESDRAFLAEYGIDYDEAMNATFTGRGAIEMMLVLEHMFPDSLLNAVPLPERVRLKDEAFLAYAPSRVKPFAGVVTLARRLVARGVVVAVASGSSPSVIDLMLRSSGLDELFRLRVSASEVPRGKPEPDVFLETARRAQVDPASCLVIEDSRHGVAAAHAAGMACIALPAAGTDDMGDFASADIIVDGGAAALDPDVVLYRYVWASS